MILSDQQTIVVDTLLSTHRELTAVDLCEYEIYTLAIGGIVLKIKKQPNIFPIYYSFRRIY